VRSEELGIGSEGVRSEGVKTTSSFNGMIFIKT
jgi:hypothetical protein